MHEKTLEQLLNVANELRAVKFHVCVTLSHEDFEAVPLTLHKQVSYIADTPTVRQNIVYCKMINDAERKQVMFQCVNTSIHEHKQ